MQNGKDYLLFYLKLLCESVDHDGNLRFSDQIPYSEDMLSTITNTNIDIVRNAINIFTSLGMMEILDDGTLFMSEVQRMMGSETYWAEKKREQRKLDNVQTLSIECPTCPTKRESKTNIKTKSDINSLIEDFGSGDDELISALRGFVDMRKSIKKPLTDRAMKMILTKLRKLSDSRDAWIEILNKSILHSWLDVYELKEETKSKSKEITPVVVNEEETDRLLRLTKEMEQ